MRARRGSAYVLVLGTTAIVSAVTLGASLALPAERRSAEWAASAARARTAAASALELGMHLATRSDFRTNYADAKTHTVAGASVTIQSLAPDGGRVSSDPSTDVLLRTVATAGQSVQTMEVLLKAKTVPMSSLATAMAAGNRITVSGKTVTADAPIVANDTITLTTAELHTDAGAGTACLGATYHGRTASGIQVALPGMDLINAYSAKATSVPFPGTRRVEKVVLSANSNPFGATNAEGIYKLDCGAMPITLRNLRVHGTIILINPGVGSKIEGSVHWTTPNHSQPALLVVGSIALSYDTAALSEWNLATNFNPSGTPYNGDDDKDVFDTYPSLIDGLVYALLDVSITRDLNFAGVLLAGNNVSVTGNAVLTHRPEIYGQPPDTMYTQVLVPDGDSWSKGSN